MDILNAEPQYKIILSPGSSLSLPLPATENTELEIGFGNGEFTVQYARSNPEIMLYGIEISQACVLRCARRAAGLKNLRIVRTDARYMLRELFADESLDKIMMNFPCPWPGNGNAHRRVTARDFSDGLAAVLKIDGKFELVTDDGEYAREVWNKLAKHDALEALSFEVNPIRPVTTKYERKWLEEGKNIHRLTFRKDRAFTAERRVQLYGEISNNREKEMHIKINNKVSEKDIISLNKISGQKPGAFWKFGGHFWGEDKYLLEVLTSDEEFEQKFYFNISRRDDGTSLIRLDKTANAFLTPGVRAAMADAAARLSVLDPKASETSK